MRRQRRRRRRHWISSLRRHHDWSISIAFRDAKGHYREVSMKAPHLEGRMDDFKKGDMVEVVYREGLAVALDPQ